MKPRPPDEDSLILDALVHRDVWFLMGAKSSQRAADIMKAWGEVESIISEPTPEATPANPLP